MRIKSMLAAALLMAAMFGAAASAAEAERLENGVAVKGDVGVGGRDYLFDVPENAVLVTLAVRSQKKGDDLALFVNAPDIARVPRRGDATWNSDAAYDNGNNESVAVFDAEGVKAGTYRIHVERKGKGACEYDITAGYIVPQTVALATPIVSSTADNRVDGSKFFTFELNEGYDFLDVVVVSETKNDGLDLYLNTPSAPYFPSAKSHEFVSANRYDGGNQEWIPLNPPRVLEKGTYRLSVLQHSGAQCPQFRLTVTAENVPLLANRKSTKKTTRRAGEYFFFDVSADAKRLLVTTESIVKGDVVDLYMNAPFDDAFPTEKAHRYASRNRYEKGSFEKIDVPDPEEGRYFIWVSNEKNGCDYVIRAVCE